ncbi:hypothetical protein F5887DRAFT_1161506 [Amanita rubescens]|nr:hypothetical protein F5887DRAFT_1161506 [Amanita rubescens]
MCSMVTEWTQIVIGRRGARDHGNAHVTLHFPICKAETSPRDHVSVFHVGEDLAAAGALLLPSALFLPPAIAHSSFIKRGVSWYTTTESAAGIVSPLAAHLTALAFSPADTGLSHACYCHLCTISRPTARGFPSPPPLPAWPVLICSLLLLVLLEGSVFVSRRARAYLQDKLKESKFNKSNMIWPMFGTSKPSLQAILTAIEEQRSQMTVPVKAAVFLVGAFAALDYLFAKIQEQDLQVSRPDGHLNKAVADGAVSFYIDHCVEYLTSFDENDPEHIAQSNEAIFRPSGRIVLPDYFDVILKGIRVSEEKEFRRSYHVESTVPIRARTEEIVAVGKILNGLTPTNPETTQQSASGMQYYRKEFDIILLFGMTELKDVRDSDGCDGIGEGLQMHNS